MICPVCEEGNVSVVYSGMKWVEFAIAEVDSDGSIYTAGIQDYDFGSAQPDLQCSTPGCVPCIEDLMS